MSLTLFYGCFFLIFTCVSRFVHVNPKSVNVDTRFGVEEYLEFLAPVFRDI